MYAAVGGPPARGRPSPAPAPASKDRTSGTGYTGLILITHGRRRPCQPRARLRRTHRASRNREACQSGFAVASPAQGVMITKTNLAVARNLVDQAISNVTFIASVAFFPCSKAVNASSSGKLCV